MGRHLMARERFGNISNGFRSFGQRSEISRFRPGGSGAMSSMAAVTRKSAGIIVARGDNNCVFAQRLSHRLHGFGQSRAVEGFQTHLNLSIVLILAFG